MLARPESPGEIEALAIVALKDRPSGRPRRGEAKGLVLDCVERQSRLRIQDLRVDVGGMYQSSLRFSFVPNPSDGVGLLEVFVQTPHFAGRGGFWAQPSNIQEFAQLLAVYPLPPASPPSIRMGYEGLMGDDLIPDIAIDASNPSGLLDVRVNLAHYLEPAERVRTSFRTHYPELERFQRQLSEVGRGRSREALLEGE